MKLTITIDVEGIDPTRVDPHDVATEALADFDDQNVRYQLGRLGDLGQHDWPEAPVTVAFVGAEWGGPVVEAVVLPPYDLQQLSAQVGPWADRNFPRPDDVDLALVVTTLGLCEEAGEAARAALKRQQRIRGTREQWTAELASELGDVIIKCADVAYVAGFDLQAALEARWADVEPRDFVTDPTGHGLPDHDEGAG